MTNEHTNVIYRLGLETYIFSFFLIPIYASKVIDRNRISNTF